MYKILIIDLIRSGFDLQLTKPQNICLRPFRQVDVQKTTFPAKNHVPLTEALLGWIVSTWVLASH